MKRIAFPALFAAAVALSGCAGGGVYSAPYGKFVMGSGTPDRLEAPATISRIDGQSTDNPADPYPVAPGSHTILVSFQSPRGITMIADQLKNLTVDVKPCTRYYINARYANMTSTDWTPVVGYTDTITECAAQFKTK
jgi:hypothetical protein